MIERTPLELVHTRIGIFRGHNRNHQVVVVIVRFGGVFCLPLNAFPIPKNSVRDQTGPDTASR